MSKVLMGLFISFIFLLSGFNISMAYEKEIKNISASIAENIAKAGKKSIAVVDFTDLQGNVTELGRFIAEEFSVALAGAGKGFEVVDRTHLKTLLKEHKLAITGVIDPTTAKKLGQIAGVDALVTGTITPFGDSVRISVKILDTATAKVIGPSSGDIPKTKAIEELLTKGIETGVSTPSGTSTPPPAKPKAIVKAEVNDFTFLVRECERAGHRTICYISVVNNAKKSRNLKIFTSFYIAYDPFGPQGPRSLLVDDLGNQYISANYRQYETNYALAQELQPDLPVTTSITYKNVVPTAKHANIILDCESEGYNFKAVLRNIPLSR
jgi:TolB-like protein